MSHFLYLTVTPLEYGFLSLEYEAFPQVKLKFHEDVLNFIN